MKLDILVLAAHPDDAELCAAGTIAAHVNMGRKVGIVDLTRGELGTRGNADIRQKEAEAAAQAMGLSVRENLGFDDGFFKNDRDHQLEIIKVIRKFQPNIVLANAVADRHPDHGRASQLCKEAFFLSGLPKIETNVDGENLEAWRPNRMYHYIQSSYLNPDFVVDITDYWDVKMKAIECFASQFYDPQSDEPSTFISSQNFMKLVESRAIEFGVVIGKTYGEGFTVDRTMGVTDLGHLV